jgi:hypothetical protein
MMYLAIIVAAAAIVFIHEWRLFAFPRYVTKSERIRLRLSALRHKVVMYAGSGKMQREERRAIVFLYQGTTLPLRFPFMYPAVSSLVVMSMIDSSLLTPPKIRRSDFSDATKPLLKEFVSVSDDLVDQFAHPVFSLAAALSGKRVTDFAREAGATIKTARKEKEVMRKWQKQAASAMA